MARRNTIEVEIVGEDKTGPALKSAKSGFEETFDEIGKGLEPAKLLEGAIMGVTSSLTSMGVTALQQIPAVTKELFDLGVRSEAVTHRFEAFAGGSEEAAQFLEAFQSATDGAISKMDAMAGAGKMLQMGLVQNADEMETMAAIATKLGDQTAGAGDRLADFSALLANRSIPRLDNFGISSGKVRARVEELKEAGYDLDEAFKLAVLEQGRISLMRLGDTSELTATKVDKVTAAWQDAKVEMGEALVQMVAADMGTDKLTTTIRNLPSAIQDSNGQIGRLIGNLAALNYQSGITQREQETAAAAANTATRNYTEMALAIEEAERSSAGLSYVSDEVKQSLNDQVISQGDLMHTVLAASEAIRREGITSQDELMRTVLEASAALDEEERAAEQAAIAIARDLSEAHINFATQYTSFEKSVADSAEQFADRREEIEQRHQEALAEIAEKGRARQVRVDEENLRLELRIARGRLEGLLERQAEFNEETSDLDRARTEKSIRALQQQIAKQEDLLGRAHQGYVTVAGQNTDALLAEEDERYAESLTNLEESQAAQEEAQRQSLGRMVLAHFNAYTEMTLAADGLTREEAQFITRMRMQISEEYGLITQDAVEAMNTQEREWAAMIAIMEGEATSFFDFFMQRFNELPTEHVIAIRTELATPDVAGPTQGGLARQHGGPVSAGVPYLVGERGPEMFIPSRSGQILDNSTTNYNLTVNSAATSMGVGAEFALMESLGTR